LQLGFSPEVRADSARSGWELGVISAEDSVAVWGLAIMDNILVDSVIPFLEKIENKGIQKTRIYK
jgi:hypothetical protein